MAGLVPAIDVFDTGVNDVDAGTSPGMTMKLTAMSLPSSVDVAIIGAGAAGLGAAHALAGSGLSVIVLEARNRLGGRAWTVQASPEVTFDVGCGWLHSADKNSFVPIARQLNFELNNDLPPWSDRAFGDAFPEILRQDFVRAIDQFYDRASEAAEAGEDAPASRYLEPGNRWNPMIDAVSTYVNGCELDQVSLLDMEAYEDTYFNWRVRAGYGTLIAAYGAPCPVALNCNVTLIDHSGQRIRIETSQGALATDKVIVTRADQPDRRRSNPVLTCLARQGRCRSRPAARRRRQGDACARGRRSLSERR
ncbi:glycine/D-amino acid oxidase-like deaminating enzyme [Bradyrhizobium sp. LB7.2]